MGVTFEPREGVQTLREADASDARARAMVNITDTAAGARREQRTAQAAVATLSRRDPRGV